MEWFELFVERVAEAEKLMVSTNKAGVLVIQQPPARDKREIFLPRARESMSNILLFIELSDPDCLAKIFSHADGKFYAAVIDGDDKTPDSKPFLEAVRLLPWSSRRFFFSDYAVWAGAAAEFVAMTSDAGFGDRILLRGKGTLPYLTGLALCQHRFRLVLDENSPLLPAMNSEMFAYRGQIEILSEANRGMLKALVGAEAMGRSIEAADIARLPDAMSAYDVGIGNFSREAVEAMNSKGFSVFRHDNRAGIATLVTRLLETDDLIRHVMGKVNLGKTEVVAGGILGKNGAVVVDNINTPEYIVGVADGMGQLKPRPYSADDEAGVRFIQSFLDSDNEMKSGFSK